jgi:PhzF family phenazine biosynthesis protein
MWIEICELNAFTKNGAGGNPAGVVLESVGLTEEDMREIARIVGFSETAFVFPSTEADYQIRYFTPNEEVDVCGHATIATFSLLLKKNLIQQGTYSINTKSGLLNVTVNADQSVFLEQNRPIFKEILPSKEIVRSLGIQEDQLMPHFPIQIVSTGLPDIIIPVKNLSVLKQLNPNYSLIKEISKRYNVTGYHVFTLETILPESTSHCRNFAPLYGINEESATGTANAALACYLATHYKEKNSFLFEQGYVMDLPSEIAVNIFFHENEITNVQVGGLASQYKNRNVGTGSLSQ